LGDISKEELKEVHSVIGEPNGHYYTKGVKEPALIYSWNWKPISALWATAVGVSLYALTIKRYNITWLYFPFVPLWTYLLYNWAR